MGTPKHRLRECGRIEKQRKLRNDAQPQNKHPKQRTPPTARTDTMRSPPTNKLFQNVQDQQRDIPTQKKKNWPTKNDFATATRWELPTHTPRTVKAPQLQHHPIGGLHPHYPQSVPHNHTLSVPLNHPSEPHNHSLAEHQPPPPTPPDTPSN